MANIKISDLTSAGAASGTQEFEVNDSLTSKKVTGTQISAFVRGEIVGADLTAAGGLLDSNNLSDLANAATARSNLGVAIGSDVQAYDAGLAYLDGLNFTNEATFKAGVNLEIGTDVQAYDASLDSLSGLSLVAGDVLYATGADTLARLAKGTAGQSLFMNSGATAPEWVTDYVCRAWVNFNGTGTVAIRASGNVSSITDNGTGSYTINFTNSLADTDYAAIGTGSFINSVNAEAVTITAYATGSVTIRTGLGNGTSTGGGTLVDGDTINVAVFR